MDEMDIVRKLTQLSYTFRRQDGFMPPHMKKDAKHRDIMMLDVILKMNQSGDLVKMSEISSYFSITPAAVSQCMKAFEQNGWVERVVLENDRRSVYIKVSPSAKAMIKRQEKMMIDTLVGFIEELGEDDAQALVRILEKAAEYFPSRHGKVPCEKGVLK